MAQDLKYNPILNDCPLSLRSVHISRLNVIIYIKKINWLIYYYYLLLWFSLKLKLADNTTILPGRSQLVCPYGRDLFVPGIFIDMALVSEFSMAFTPHIPLQVVRVIL